MTISGAEELLFDAWKKRETDSKLPDRINQKLSEMDHAATVRGYIGFKNRVSELRDILEAHFQADSRVKMKRSALTDERILELWLSRKVIHDGDLILQLRDFARTVEQEVTQ